MWLASCANVKCTVLSYERDAGNLLHSEEVKYSMWPCVQQNVLSFVKMTSEITVKGLKH